MFGRSNQDQKPSPPPSPAAAPPPPAQPMAVPSAAPAPAAPLASESVIGEDLAIIGQQITVVSHNRLMVNGTIHGNVNGKEVFVGPRGKVVGTVTANHIEVEGVISGALRGASVSLKPSARVDGDIFHQNLAISEGAQFDGCVRRPQDPSEITPVLDAESIQAKADGA